VRHEPLESRPGDYDANQTEHETPDGTTQTPLSSAGQKPRGKEKLPPVLQRQGNQHRISKRAVLPRASFKTRTGKTQYKKFEEGVEL